MPESHSPRSPEETPAHPWKSFAESYRKMCKTNGARYPHADAQSIICAADRLADPALGEAIEQLTVDLNDSATHSVLTSKSAVQCVLNILTALRSPAHA